MTAAGSAGERSLPGRLKDAAVRTFLTVSVGSYVRVRVSGAERLPEPPYLICFNHPSWSDPLVIVGHWPDRRRRVWIFGPREVDMSVGRRNALIRWTERGVPFKPGGADAIDVTRRAVAALRGGDVLAVAGEGRLSDEEGRLLPLETGLGHFAILAGVPIVPVAISGTRWLRLGKTVRVAIGEAVVAPEGARGRRAAAELTAQVQTSLQVLLDHLAPHDERIPGPIGRWLSEAFNERPWLGAAGAGDASGGTEPAA